MRKHLKNLEKAGHPSIFGINRIAALLQAFNPSIAELRELSDLISADSRNLITPASLVIIDESLFGMTNDFVNLNFRLSTKKSYKTKS